MSKQAVAEDEAAVARRSASRPGCASAKVTPVLKMSRRAIDDAPFEIESIFDLVDEDESNTSIERNYGNYFT